LDVAVDTNSDTLPSTYPMSQIAIYAGWYASDVDGPFARPNVEFMPGAFAYHLYSFSASSLHTPTNHWCGPLLAQGATCTMGCVYEPYLSFTPNLAFFLQQLLNGSTFGEAAWASQLALSWYITVIGDPLYQPFKIAPAERHDQLAREKNPLIAWSFNRLVNLDLAQGLRAPPLAQFLEQVPQTATSAVLTEKLAELYAAQGKPSSAIAAWQRALTLQPSPQQSIRIRRLLTEKLLAADRWPDASENLRLAISEAPAFPDVPKLREQLKVLTQKNSIQNKK
jgi:tetratricopeptide (TPR) repeat protein